MKCLLPTQDGSVGSGQEVTLLSLACIYLLKDRRMDRS